MVAKTVSDADRFVSKYLADAATGCWNWLARLDADGYGAQVKIGSRSDGTRTQVRPHRWMFEQANGAIQPGLVIDHLCRNRRCVNPAHMEAVTPLENHRRGLRARRLICPRGHAIAGSNEVRRDGGFRCRICVNAYHRAYGKATGHAHSKAYRARKTGGRKSVSATT